MGPQTNSGSSNCNLECVSASLCCCFTKNNDIRKSQSFYSGLSAQQNSLLHSGTVTSAKSANGVAGGAAGLLMNNSLRVRI